LLDQVQARCGGERNRIAELTVGARRLMMEKGVSESYLAVLRGASEVQFGPGSMVSDQCAVMFARYEFQRVRSR
jgi:hypothetical protein